MGHANCCEPQMGCKLIMVMSTIMHSSYLLLWSKMSNRFYADIDVEIVSVYFSTATGVIQGQSTNSSTAVQDVQHRSLHQVVSAAHMLVMTGCPALHCCCTDAVPFLVNHKTSVLCMRYRYDSTVLLHLCTPCSLNGKCTALSLGLQDYTWHLCSIR